MLKNNTNTNLKILLKVHVNCSKTTAKNCSQCLIRNGQLDPDGCDGDCALDKSHHCVPSKICMLLVLYSFNLVPYLKESTVEHFAQLNVPCAYSKTSTTPRKDVLEIAILTPAVCPARKLLRRMPRDGF